MKKKRILGLGILVLVMLLMTGVYLKFREKPVEGSKEITIEVVNSKEESKVYELRTDAEFLRQAMEEAKEQGLSFEGEEGPYGLQILVVNGETADYNADQSYWGFYVNDEYCNYGIDEQPVEDGDAFAIVYTK